MAKYDPTKKYKEAGLTKTKAGYKVESFKAKTRGKTDASKLPAARVYTLLTPPGTKRGYDAPVKSKVPKQARLYQTTPGALQPKAGPRYSVGQYQQTVSERKRTAGRMASVERRKKQISAYQSAAKKKTAPKNTGKKNRLR